MVQQLAAELQYEPNQAAISFKQGKTMTLGVILPNLQEEFFSLAINGIEDVATRNNYTVLIGQSHDNTQREEKIVDTMRKHRVDGLIVSLAKTTRNFQHFLQLEKYNIPVVFFDRVPDYPEAWSVSCNLQHSAEDLVDWLVGQGHKKIGFIKGPETLMPSKERLQGYYNGLKKHGIKPESSYVVTTDLSAGKSADAVHKLMALRSRPTAIIAFNDYVALDAMKYVKNMGLQINKDITFVSFANLPVTNYLDQPPAVSIEQFPYLQAESAADILFRLINKEHIPDLPRTRVLEGKLVVNTGTRS